MYSLQEHKGRKEFDYVACKILTQSFDQGFLGRIVVVLLFQVPQYAGRWFSQNCRSFILPNFPLSGTASVLQLATTTTSLLKQKDCLQYLQNAPLMLTKIAFRKFQLSQDTNPGLELVRTGTHNWLAKTGVPDKLPPSLTTTLRATAALPWLSVYFLKLCKMNTTKTSSVQCQNGAAWNII